MELSSVSLVKTFRVDRSTRRAVDDVSLRVPSGSFVAIVGESGSGKSTVARMLLQLIAPDEGDVLLDGRPVSRRSRSEMADFRASVQAILQDPSGSLNPRKTVRSLLTEVARKYSPPGEDRKLDTRIREVLTHVRMEPTDDLLARYPHELSGGQRQRILISRALIPRPKIIVADEAVSALDVSIKAGILNLLCELQVELGIGYAFITHDLAVVERVADYVYVMSDGKVVEEGPTGELFGRPSHPVTVGLLAARLELDSVLADRFGAA